MQIVLNPHKQLIEVEDGTKELQTSKTPFPEKQRARQLVILPKANSIMTADGIVNPMGKESNAEALNISKDDLESKVNFEIFNVRFGSLGIVSWTCDSVPALVQRFNSYSRRLFCCNPLG